MEYRVRKRNIEEAAYGVRGVDEILTDAVLRRFHLRAGFTTTSPRALALTRNYYCDFLGKLLDAVVVLMQHHNRRGILLTDVLHACRHYGIRLYGYDELCVLETPWGLSEYHITEMVEFNTTFSRAADYEEPDHEPSAFYPKTDFVQNQKTWDADIDEEDGSGSDDSEWSWYGESDADSESDDDDCEDLGVADKQTRRWRKSEDPKQVFLKSLRAAQDVVDDQLLAEPESEVTEFDAPVGQGYESDCDASHEPESYQLWKKGAQSEDVKWLEKDGVFRFATECDEDAADTEMMDDGDEDGFEDVNDYVIPRQVFMGVFYAELTSSLRCSYAISAVALSALHNVSEQYLYSALNSGVLRAQIVSALMEERLESSLLPRTQLQLERKKVEQAEAAMAEMRAAFKSKEIDLQRQIAELERQVRCQVRRRNETPVPDVEMELQQRKSPGKRKARNKDEPVLVKEKTQVPTSLVGSLRSRLHEYSLRKKAKISPV